MHRISNKLIYTYWMGYSNIVHPSLFPPYLVSNEWCIVLESTPFQFSILYILSRMLFPFDCLENRCKSTILWFIYRGFVMLDFCSKASGFGIHLVLLV